MRPSDVSEDRRYFISWGTLSPRKGLDRLVRAYRDAVTILPEWDLLLAGGEADTATGYAATLRDIADGTEAEDRVHITGYLDSDEIAEMLALADVFVHTPCDRTSASGPVADAIHFGLPLMLTRVELFSEMFDDDEVLFVEPTEASIAAGLARIVADPRLRTTLKAATDDLAERLSWERQAEKMYRIY